MQLVIIRQMNAIILFLIGIPAIEIYLLIKVGGVIGAFNTIFLIFFTAITGIYFAKIAGLSTLKSGFTQIVKNEMPIYEIISGAALGVAAFLLIVPGFVTDFIGFLLILPLSRKIIIKFFSSRIRKKDFKKDFIEGEFEENNKKDNDLTDN